MSTVSRTSRNEKDPAVARDETPKTGRIGIPRVSDLLALGCLMLSFQPADALAWGPVTHVSIGSSVLDSISLLPIAVASILARHRLTYLYGCIAADIVFAKRLSKVKQFCHHWTTAWRLIDTAETDEHRAFAYGYVSHLAADTVAHGKFVPRQVAMSGVGVNFGHLYWELRADNLQAEETQRALRDVLDANHDEHHRSLAKHITNTFLPYDVNRLLFNRMNFMASEASFRRRVERLSRAIKGRLPEKLLAGYESECVDRTISVLAQGSSSPVLREDPNGTSALMQLRVQRRELRKMRRKGFSTMRQLRETSRSLAPSTNGADDIAIRSNGA